MKNSALCTILYQQIQSSSLAHLLLGQVLWRSTSLDDLPEFILISITFTISMKLKLYNTCIIPIFLQQQTDLWVLGSYQERSTSTRHSCSRSMVFVNAIGNQMVPPCVEWLDETDNRATISAIVQCPSMAFLPVGHIGWMPDETDAKKILTASPLENWRRSAWIKQSTWLIFVHSGDWSLKFGATHC